MCMVRKIERHSAKMKKLARHGLWGKSEPGDYFFQVPKFFAAVGHLYHASQSTRRL